MPARAQGAARAGRVRRSAVWRTPAAGVFHESAGCRPRALHGAFRRLRRHQGDHLQRGRRGIPPPRHFAVDRGSSRRRRGAAAARTCIPRPDTERPAKASVDYLRDACRRRSGPDRHRGAQSSAATTRRAPRPSKSASNAASPGARSSTSARAFEARIGGTNEPSVPGFVEHAQWVFGTSTIDETRCQVASR